MEKLTGSLAPLGDLASPFVTPAQLPYRGTRCLDGSHSPRGWGWRAGEQRQAQALSVVRAAPKRLGLEALGQLESPASGLGSGQG